MGRRWVLLTGEQNLHLKPFRCMKKAQGGHEKLKGLGREMKDTATSGNGRARSQAHPWILCRSLGTGLCIPALRGRRRTSSSERGFKEDPDF